MPDLPASPAEWTSISPRISPLALANTLSIQLCSPLSGADTRRQAPRYTATLRAVSGAVGSTQQAASVPSAATRTLS